MQLNLISPIGDTGYGVAGWNIYKELLAQKHKVALFQRQQNTNQEKSPLVNIGDKNLKNFDYDAPCVNIWHQDNLGLRYGSGPLFALTFFELDRLTPNEIHHINYPDHLFVASKWAKDIVDQYREDKPTSVLPMGIDPLLFPSAQYSYSSDRPYVFFNGGKWEVRKGHDALVRMFNREFKPTDNVELWMLPASSLFLDKKPLNDWNRMYLESPMGLAGKIKIWPYQKSVCDLMKRADCGIFPARAEGWNLELLEMMAIGKPVIATNYSAHTEFCTESNCFLAEVPYLELAYDDVWFFGQGKWAKIGHATENALRKHMRYCYENKVVNNPAGIETGQKFTWANTVKTLVKIIKSHK